MSLKDYLVSLKQYEENKRICDELKSYKNIHKGERCFIIGTGPSLKTEDLDKLKDEFTFSSHRIFEIFPKN